MQSDFLSNLDAIKADVLPSVAALFERFPGLPRVALSIRQPWSFFVVNGLKDVENRDWNTYFRGPVLIHAAKKLYPVDEYTEEFIGKALGRPYPKELSEAHAQLGGIVGVAEIVDCVTSSRSPWFMGKYGFVLANARPLPFVAYKGALGFFKVA